MHDDYYLIVFIILKLPNNDSKLDGTKALAAANTGKTW
jgi:hypothetical protein